MFKKTNNQKGMTYVELIVVLSIFSVISSVVVFNYNDFQAMIEIKNLASDIALKIVEAQKASLSGRLPSVVPGGDWKPAYGVFFDTDPATENKEFLYFVDTTISPIAGNLGIFNGSDCGGECVSKSTMTKGNYIKEIRVYNTNGTSPSIGDLAVSFVRPDSSARLASGLSLLSNVLRVEITVESPRGARAYIVIYPSGRVEVK